MKGIAKSFKDGKERAKVENIIDKYDGLFDEEKNETSFVDYLKVVEPTDSRAATFRMEKGDDSFKQDIEDIIKDITGEIGASYARSGDYISIVFKDAETAKFFRETLALPIPKTENFDGIQPKTPEVKKEPAGKKPAEKPAKKPETPKEPTGKQHVKQPEGGEKPAGKEPVKKPEGKRKPSGKKPAEQPKGKGK